MGRDQDQKTSAVLLFEPGLGKDLYQSRYQDWDDIRVSQWARVRDDNHDALNEPSDCLPINIRPFLLLGTRGHSPQEI